MYGPILSVLLMGMVPVWGLQGGGRTDLQDITVAPPASHVLDGTAIRTLQNRLSASGVIVVDLDSGQAVYEHDADTARPMASLTKLMTALLIVEHHDLDELVTIPQDIPDVDGNVVHLPPGDQFLVRDLLSALLISSANDAAVTLARYHSGSVSAFVQEMNKRGRELGLKDTRYANPTGLDALQQRASPREIAWLTMYVLRNPLIAERMSERGTQIRSRQGKTIYLTHTHALLHASVTATNEDQSDLAIVRAGKTGTTDGAGQCLLSIVNLEGKQYIVVLLRSLDRYADMRLVLDTLNK